MKNLEVRSTSIYLTNTGDVHVNIPTVRLAEHAILNGEGCLASSGALLVRTGDRTGRSPRDKFVAKDAAVAEEIWWGDVNRPIEPEVFERVKGKVESYLQNREIFVFDGFSGADPQFRLPVRIITERAWHSLFAQQLFIRPTDEELKDHQPEFTVVSVPGFRADPVREGIHSEAFILLSFAQRLVLIGGTEYAGEIKKSIFSVMNFLMPHRGVVPMHCSANVGADGDTALFFGLSGTGKTTLSADPQRRLVGDDEHGWSDAGVFNFEGGCYAKCIRLSESKEPQIWRAIRMGSVVENVSYDNHTREADYDCDKITENSRVAYPVDFIPGAIIPGVADHPRKIMFLTADAFGVLPPIARLDRAQTMYHFVSGYTSKLAGTETGVTEPQTTFSACFGAPFLPLHPQRYAEMLARRIEEHDARVYLVNTGWTGGPYGVGQRIPLEYTRALIGSALDGSLEEAEFVPHPVFGIGVPKSCLGVPAEILDPRSTWSDKSAYDAKARELADRFRQNSDKFDLSSEIRAAGPRAA